MDVSTHKENQALEKLRKVDPQNSVAATQAEIASSILSVKKIREEKKPNTGLCPTHALACVHTRTYVPTYMHIYTQHTCQY